MVHAFPFSGEYQVNLKKSYIFHRFRAVLPSKWGQNYKPVSRRENLDRDFSFFLCHFCAWKGSKKHPGSKAHSKPYYCSFVACWSFGGFHLNSEHSNWPRYMILLIKNRILRTKVCSASEVSVLFLLCKGLFCLYTFIAFVCLLCGLCALCVLL